MQRGGERTQPMQSFQLTMLIIKFVRMGIFRRQEEFAREPVSVWCHDSKRINFSARACTYSLWSARANPSANLPPPPHFAARVAKYPVAFPRR